MTAMLSVLCSLLTRTILVLEIILVLVFILFWNKIFYYYLVVFSHNNFNVYVILMFTLFYSVFPAPNYSSNCNTGQPVIGRPN